MGPKVDPFIRIPFVHLTLSVLMGAKDNVNSKQSYVK